MRPSLTVALLLVLASTALAYVPTMDKLVTAWTHTYNKAPALLLAGSVEQGAAVQPFRAWATPHGIVFELAGRAVSDATAALALGLILAPAKAYPSLVDGGLDATKTGLARHEGKIAYTLGSVGEKQPGTQVWLDRQTYAPLLVLFERDGIPVGRIAYLGYDVSPSRLVPAEIRIEGEEQRIFRIEKLTPVKK